MLQPKMPEAAKLTSLSNGGVPMPCLPSITVNKMTQAQLRKFIPHLLQNVTGHAIAGFGPLPKPTWWPGDVPWHHLRLDHKTNTFKEITNVENLKSIVRNCYKYYGQERNLNGSPNSPESATSPLTMIDNYYRDVPNDGLKQKNSYTRADKWGELPSCNPRSSSRTRRVSSALVPDMALTKNTSLPGKDCSSVETKPFLEIYICFFCEKEFENKRDMCHHQAHCKEQPPELKVVLSLPRQPLHIQPHQINLAPQTCTPVARPPKKSFMEGLNLLACQKAKEIKAKVRESTDVDCEIIDVIEPPKTPVAITPPRTPKLLISQLSRDESWTRRKSASFSWAPDDHSDDESITSGPSENEPDGFSACQRNATLLSIPFTSLLGQRIRKHVKSEGQSAVVWNVESFCKTPVKNNALQRLRERQSNYPVTFKKTKRFSTKHTHEYKFNKKQKSEFLECLEVGLSKRSLRLLKRTKRCSVKLKRLTKLQLNHWLRPGKKVNVPVMLSKPALKLVDEMKTPVCLLGRTVFPQKPALLSADMDRILGLKKRVSQESHQHTKLPLGSIVSEQLNAEASQQKLTVYRSLLSEYSSSHSAPKNLEASKAPCLINLLTVPNTKTTLPKKPTQLAQMLNTPLSKLPVQPPGISVNHVEKWLTNNDFYAKDIEQIPTVKRTGQRTSTPTTVPDKTVSHSVKRKLNSSCSKSNKYGKFNRKLEDKPFDTSGSDSISVHSLSSSEDENSVENSRCTSVDGLPVIKNTFSLAPGHFQPFNSDRGLRLIIPPLPNIRLPRTVQSRSLLSPGQSHSPGIQSSITKHPMSQKASVKSREHSSNSNTSASSPVKSESSTNSSGSSAPVRRSKRLQVLHPTKNQSHSQPAPSTRPTSADKIKSGVEIIWID